MDTSGRSADRVRGVPHQVTVAARELRRNMTRAEEVLWAALRGRKLDGLKFRRQHAIGPYVLDFCCPSHRVVIEVDGGVHETMEEQVRDERRSEQLAAFGYTILRFRNEDVLSNQRAVLSRIRAEARDD